MKKYLVLLVMAAVSWIPASNAAPLFPGDVPADRVVTIGTFEWVWASPCEGNGSGCAEPVTLHDGWRFPTTPEYNSMLTSAADLLRAGSLCGSGWFQGNWSHCDFSDGLWRADNAATNGTYYDTLLIRAAANGVPEPASLALVGFALIGLAYTRRSKQA